MHQELSIKHLKKIYRPIKIYIYIWMVNNTLKLWEKYWMQKWIRTEAYEAILDIGYNKASLHVG